jgi:hypothetical protein
VKDVVITRADRDEFERAHNVGSASGVLPLTEN